MHLYSLQSPATAIATLQAGGICVGPVTATVGEAGAVCLAGVALAASLVPAHHAYTAHFTGDDSKAAGGAPSKSATQSTGPSPPPSGDLVGRWGLGWLGKLWDAVGLSSLRAAPMLPWLFLCTIVMQALATLASLVFSQWLEISYTSNHGRSAFSGNFFALANFLAAALQFAGVPLVFRRVPLHVVLCLLPVTTVLACIALVASPSLLSAAALLLSFKVTEYAAFAAAREALYAPLSFNARSVPPMAAACTCSRTCSVSISDAPLPDVPQIRCERGCRRDRVQGWQGRHRGSTGHPCVCSTFPSPERASSECGGCWLRAVLVLDAGTAACCCTTAPVLYGTG